MNTINDLRRWLGTLPVEMGEGSVDGTLSYGGNSPMKRVVAYRYKNGSSCGIVINPLGTYLNDAFYEDVEVVSVFDWRFDSSDPDPKTS